MAYIIRVVGDVHGKYGPYAKIIKNGPPSVQVGDMGVGFIRYSGPRHGSFDRNPPHQKMVEANAKFIRGNHDNPRVCKNHSQCIPDGTVDGNVMYIGGALSVDRQWRQRDYNWWPDEELSYTELMKLIDVYEAAKPEIMITHDCPSYAAQILCALNQKRHIDDGSRTRPALESMFNIHKPKLWIHGHWHLNSDQTIKGTRFICLNELAWVDINLDTGEVVNDGTTEFGCIKQEYPQTEEYDAGVIE